MFGAFWIYETEPVELPTKSSGACIILPTKSSGAAYKIKRACVILNTETDLLHGDTETNILLMIDIFCILKKLVYAHLKLALYTLAETVDLQGYWFFSISLCHNKFIIINYTYGCKDALFGI